MKLKNYGLGILFLGFSFSASAQTIPVAQSGIDWRNSTLSIERFQPSDPSHRESFNCFGATYDKLPVEKKLVDLGFNNPDSGPLTLTQKLEDLACFQQAGWYEIRLKLYDRAENLTDYTTVLTVVPSELSLTDSTIAPVASKTSGGKGVIADLTNRLTCTSPTLMADGQDECILELHLRDRFANVIAPEGVSGDLTVKLPTQAAASHLDASTNLYGAFLAGLYFENNKKEFNFHFPQENKNLKLGLKAYVPTLEKTIPKTANGPKEIEAKPQPIKLSLDYREKKDSEELISSIKTITPLFSPWVKILAHPQGSIENFILLPRNRSVNLPLQLTSLTQKALPTKISIDWVAPALKELRVRFGSVGGERTTEFKNLIRTKTNPEPFDLDLVLMQLDGTFSEESFFLEPRVTYLQNLNGKNQVVRYPASILKAKGISKLEAFKALQLKASVEGKLLADGESAEANHLILSESDKILFTGWREQVNRQAISLIRGQSPRTENTFNINKDFGDKDIAYFKGTTVRLTSDDPGNTPMTFGQGAKTLIIEDGNLHITRDLLYKSEADSLGIIVINTKPGDPERGHVFVHQNVGRIVGSYFLDGALVSTQKLEDPDISDIIEGREATPNIDPEAPLVLQFVLEGTMVARNTLGGADLSPAQGPNGQNVQRELALIYDLNYFRRYEPLFTKEGRRLPDVQNNFCFKGDGKSCYSNPAPTVIRYDPRVQAISPPGFKAR